MWTTRLVPPVWGLLWGGVQAALVRCGGGRRRFRGQTAVTVAVAAAGVALGATAARELVLHRTQVEPMDPSKTSTIVTSGVYGYTRNPIYLSMALLLTAAAVGTGRFRALAGVAGFLFSVTPQILAEEEALTAKFGDSYDAYRQGVRRWL